MTNNSHTRGSFMLVSGVENIINSISPDATAIEKNEPRSIYVLRARRIARMETFGQRMYGLQNQSYSANIEGYVKKALAAFAREHPELEPMVTREARAKAKVRQLRALRARAKRRPGKQ